MLSEVAITGQCNLRGKFYYTGCGLDFKTPGVREMNLGEIRQVLDVIYREAQTPTVIFTGGEPCLRPDLPEMVAYAKSVSFRVNLNGPRPPPYC